MAETKKIKMLVIPSDTHGVGHFRSIWPHQYIQEHYSDEFDIDIVTSMPSEDLEKFFKKYDIVHIHKMLDAKCGIINMLKFLGKKVVLDIDDHYKLGNDHPMSITANKERWHEPIIKHLEMADVVTTTTPIFANILKRHNKNVFVFPNAIDPTWPQYTVPKTEGDGRLRVGIICG